MMKLFKKTKDKIPKSEIITEPKEPKTPPVSKCGKPLLLDNTRWEASTGNFLYRSPELCSGLEEGYINSQAPISRGIYGFIVGLTFISRQSLVQLKGKFLVCGLLFLSTDPMYIVHLYIAASLLCWSAFGIPHRALRHYLGSIFVFRERVMTLPALNISHLKGTLNGTLVLKMNDSLK